MFKRRTCPRVLEKPLPSFCSAFGIAVCRRGPGGLTGGQTEADRRLIVGANGGCIRDEGETKIFFANPLTNLRKRAIINPAL